MSKPFSGLVSKMSATARAEVEARVRIALRALPFAYVRSVLGLRQTDIAEKQGVTQVAISKLESRSDFLLSTLYSFVESTGGKLKVHLDYPRVSFSLVGAVTDSGKIGFHVEDVPDEPTYRATSGGWMVAGCAQRSHAKAKFVAANDTHYHDLHMGYA